MGEYSSGSRDLDFGRIELPGALTPKARCHNAHQLLSAQLAIYRQERGIKRGVQVDAEEDVRSPSDIQRIRLACEDHAAAYIQVLNPDGSTTDYFVDTKSESLNSQVIDSEGRTQGSIRVFAADLECENELLWLSTLLFDLNDPAA